jgi:hypothetical protein
LNATIIRQNGGVARQCHYDGVTVTPI